MKALTLTAIRTPLELVDRPDLTPSAGEVVVRLRAAALNRRDYWISQGMYPGIKPPVVPGSDGAGVVSLAGRDAEDQAGREVIINPGFDWGENPLTQSAEFTILGLPRDGTFASEVAVPASQIHAKPGHLTWEEAAAIPLGGVTAWRAVFTQGGLKPGDTVLITGIGGGVATFALQFAVAVGAEVWVTSSSEEKINRAVELGAKGGFDYRREEWSRELAKVAAPDLIIDSAGGSDYGSLINVAAAGGRIVNYGATAGAPEKVDLFRIFWKQLRLQGSTMGSPDDFSAMLKFVEEKQITPIVDLVRPLEEGNEALKQMAASSQFGKLVLAVN